MGSSNRGALTAVGVASLEHGIHCGVHWGDVLRSSGDWRVGHDGVGFGWFINSFELQALVVNPEVRWLQIFGIALVFVGSIGRLAGRTFPEGHIKQSEKRNWEGLSTIFSIDLILLFLLCGWATCTQKSSNHHQDDGERPHRHDDDNNQYVIITGARHIWFSWNTWNISDYY